MSGAEPTSAAAEPGADHGFAVAMRAAAPGTASARPPAAAPGSGDVGALNAWLDRLPRAASAAPGEQTPAFRACGVASYHVAVLVTLGVGLAAGLPGLLLAGGCAVAAVSFFAWALLRRAITRVERLVLLEHVWIACGCVAAFAWAAGADVLATLDAMTPGLAVFLAGGRVGCTLAGCCHGRPAPVGIAYGAEAVRSGLPRELVGVRLLPVAALEAAALLAIAAVAVGLALTAAPGVAFVWFLLAYAVARFGLEGLRGDARAQWLGLSRNRWMCLAQLVFALWLGEPAARPVVAWGALAAVLAAALIARAAFDAYRGLRGAAHRAELHALGAELERRGGSRSAPLSARTSRGVTLAASRAADGGLHCSLRLPTGRADLHLLRDLAASAWPAHDDDDARLGPHGVLHLHLRLAKIGPR